MYYMQPITSTISILNHLLFFLVCSSNRQCSNDEPVAAASRSGCMIVWRSAVPCRLRRYATREGSTKTKRLIYSVLCYVQNKSASWSVAMLLRLAVIVVVHQSVNFNRFLSNRFFFPIMMMRSNPSDLTPPELSRVRVLRTGALGSGQSSLLNAGPSQSNGGPWWSLTLGDLCLGFNSLHWIRFLTIHRD